MYDLRSHRSWENVIERLERPRWIRRARGHTASSHWPLSGSRARKTRQWLPHPRYSPRGLPRPRGLLPRFRRVEWALASSTWWTWLDQKGPPRLEQKVAATTLHLHFIYLCSVPWPCCAVPWAFSPLPGQGTAWRRALPSISHFQPSGTSWLSWLRARPGSWFRTGTPSSPVCCRWLIEDLTYRIFSSTSYHYRVFISWHIFKRLNSRVILEV